MQFSEIEIELGDTQSSPEKKKLQELKDDDLPEGIEKFQIKLMVYMQFIAQLFLMIDNGFLPAISVKYKAERGMTEATFGLLGSCVFLGQAIGSFMATPILQKLPPKYVLMFCLMINIGSLVVFTLTNIIPILCVVRCVTGIMQVFFTIYMPVWVDAFGNEEEKPQWIALLIVSNPLGTVLGYVLAAGVQDSIGWAWAFYIQSILLVPGALVLMTVEHKYYDVSGTGKKIINHRDRLRLSLRSSRSRSNSSDTDRANQERGVVLNPEDIEANNTDVLDNELEDTSTCTRVCKVLGNWNYFFVALSISFLFWLSMGINYWMSDYITLELKFPKQQTFVAFSVIAITGAIFGVIVGGQISACFGGYNNVKSFYFLFGEGVFCIFVGMPIPFVSNPWIVFVLLWFVLFVGASTLPGLTGILLNTVGADLRTQAAAFGNIFFNCFGMLPSPFVFGLIAQYAGYRAAMIQLMAMIPMVVLALIMVFKSLSQHIIDMGHTQLPGDESEEQREEVNSG